MNQKLIGMCGKLDNMSSEIGDMHMHGAAHNEIQPLQKALNRLAEEHNTLMDEMDTFQQPVHGWACFHCGYRFFDYDKAKAHFGEDPKGTAKCKEESLIKLDSYDKVYELLFTSLGYHPSEPWADDLGDILHDSQSRNGVAVVANTSHDEYVEITLRIPRKKKRS